MRHRIGLATLVLAAAVAPVLAQQAPAGQAPSATELSRRVRELEAEVAELRVLLEAAATPDSGAEPSTAALSARLDRLEAAVVELRKDVRAIGDDAQITADAVDDLSETELRRAQLTVYGSLVGADYDDSNSVISGEAVELVASGRPHERLGFFTEIEFERAAEVGGERGGEVVVEQAYATLALAPWLDFKAGILLMPFGNYNLDHYAPTREVISRPLVSHAVVPSDWTDNGLGFSGRQGLGNGWVLAYDAFLVAGLDEDVATLDSRAARQPFGEDNNNNKAAVARIAAGHRGRFEAGLSYYTGTYDDASTQSLDGWALDLSSRLGPLQLAGEYNHFAAELAAADRDATLEGFYVRGVYDLFRGLLRSGRHGELFPEARLSFVAQYGEVKLRRFLPDPGSDQESRWTLGLNYRPSHHWVLKLNRETNSSDAGQPILHGNSDAWLTSVAFVY